MEVLEASSWASCDEIDEDLRIGGGGLGTVTLVAVGMPVLLNTEPLFGGHLFAIPENTKSELLKPVFAKTTD